MIARVRDVGRGVAAVVRKETTELFASSIAYVVVALFLFIPAVWLFGVTEFIARGVASLRSYYGVMPALLIVVAPAITMRSWADETRSGTIEGLLTLPIERWQIVTGKLIAGSGLVAIALALSLLVPLTLRPLGGFEPGEIIAQYVGLVVFAVCAVAVGQLVSSLTRNQITSLFVSMVVLLGLFVARPAIAGGPHWLSAALRYVSFDVRFESFNRGIIDTRDLAYFSFLSVVAGVLTTRRISERHRRRERFAERVTRWMAAAILVLAALNAEVHSLRFDLTSDRVFTLSEASRRTIREVSDTVTVTYFVSRELLDWYSEIRDVADLIDEYSVVGGTRVVVRVVHPEDEPERSLGDLGIVAQQLQVHDERGPRWIDVFSGVRVEHLGRVATLPVVVDSSTLEYDLTSAIRRVVDGRPLAASVLVADRTRSIDDYSFLVGELARTYSLHAVARGEPIADDVDVVFVVDAQSLSRAEVDRVADYLGRGGAVLFAVSGYSIDLDGTLVARRIAGEPVREFLTEVGVVVGHDLLLDERHQSIPVRETAAGFDTQRLVGYPFWPVFTRNHTSETHPVTAHFAGLDLYWPTWLQTAAGDFSVETIVASSPRAWLVEAPHDVTPGADGADASGRPRGQFGVVATGTKVATGSRIAVVADGGFVVDRLVATTDSRHNIAFAVSLVQWLSSDDEMISVRARRARSLRFDEGVTADRRAVIGAWSLVLNGVVVPGAMLVVGAFVIVRRRRRVRGARRPGRSVA